MLDERADRQDLLARPEVVEDLARFRRFGADDDEIEVVVLD